MTELPHKKKGSVAIKRERDFEKIQQLAIELIEKHGFSEFKLEMLIDKAPISRGTFYKLIPSKETLHSLLAVRGLKVMAEYMGRAQAYEGKPRVKMVGYIAAYLLMEKTNPALFKAIFAYNPFSSHTPIDQQLKNEYKENYDFIVNKMKSTIDDAIEGGDLTLPSSITPFTLAFSLWNGVCGITSRSLLDGPSEMAGGPIDYYRNYLRTICDLLEWQPTSDTLDYNPYLKDIMLQIFPKELKMVGGF